MTTRFGSVLSTTGLVAALALMVVLAWQNQSLRAALHQARLEAVIPPIGFTVPEFRGVTLAGDSVTVGRAAGSQVLFFFSTTCPSCRRAIPAWEAISRRAEHDFTVLALTQDADSLVRGFMADQRVDFDVVRFPDPTYAQLYRADAVPLTVVVDPGGKVLGSRPGVLTPIVVDSILNLARGWTGAEARLSYPRRPS